MIPVWDLPVRAFHWLLLVAVAVAAVTGFISGMSALTIHLVAGVIVAVLVGARAVWGVLGPTRARFAAFAYGPRAVIGHVRDLLAGHEHRHLGHNPLGALMVFGFLLVLTAIVVTGTISLGGMLKQGPLAAFTSYATGRSLLGIHQSLAVLLLVMIAAHLGGVWFESWRGRENLLRAMVTGHKRAEPASDPAAPRAPWPRLGAVLVLGLCGVAAVSVAALTSLPLSGVPPAELDPTYDAECGSCHFTFSPSLSPARVWNDLLSHLDRHFGLQVRLDAGQVAQLRAYLDANSAEHWDTLPAQVFRERDPAQPLRITATRYWRRMHAAIPDAVFRRRAISGKLSCSACHADATTARFAPQEIDIPDQGD